MSSMSASIVRGCGVLAVAIGIACSGIAEAHHTGALFDRARFISVKGTVKKWEWANPHCWLYLTVTKADGTVEDWGFEAGGPNMLSRKGWSADDIKVGDKVVVDTHPARNGQHLGMLQTLFLPNGKVFSEMAPGGAPGAGGADQEAAPDPALLPKKPQGEEYK